nr:SpaA isopeptide-forming pilin-related protein [Arcanobacterium phocae]
MSSASRSNFVKSVLISLVLAVALVLSGLIPGVSADAAEGDSVQKTGINVLKVAGDTKLGLAGASLEIRKGDNDPAGELMFEWQSTAKLKRVDLPVGTYTLYEKVAPDNYEKVTPVVISVKDDGVVLYKNATGEFVEPTIKQIDDNPITAFNDFDDESQSWPGTPYGKFYYAKTEDSGDKGEVIYCLNIELKSPPDSYDGTGEDVKPNLLNPEVTTYQRISVEDISSLVKKPFIEDASKLNKAISKVIWAGYPNNSQGFKGDLSDAQFRTATQLAIYKLSDSFDIETEKANNRETHGFEGILLDQEPNNKVKEAYDKLLNFALESTESLPDKFVLNLYTPSTNNYQNLVGTKFDNPDYVPVIKIVDPVKPVAPKPSISTVATVDGEKVVELDGVKPVEVVDTIKWENLPAGQYVAEATYVVNGGDESVVAGEQKFVVTKDQAAFGEAVVPVIVTIPESALTTDGKPVKFTVLERVFKADDAGEKTGKAVAEHVDKDSVEQTVTVTVKKPVAPKPSTVTVNFSKVIAGQGDELKGAALKIVKGDKADGSDVVAEWTSTGAVKTFELNEGIYALVEDQAPLGFLKAEAITFRVTITADSKKIEILQNGAWVEAKDSTVTMEDVRDTSPKTPTPEKKQTPETPKSVPNQGGILAKTGINLAGLGVVALLFVAGGAVLRGRKKA